MKHSTTVIALALVGATGCPAETIQHGAGGSTGGAADVAGSTGLSTASGTDTALHEALFPDDIAEAYCTALFECGGPLACFVAAFPYDTYEDCIAHEQAEIDELQGRAFVGGLSYDGDCAQQIIDAYAEVDCATEPQIRVWSPTLLSAAGLECQPYVGRVPEQDGNCIEVAGTNLTDCEAGLRCLDETCTPNDSAWACATGCPDGTTCRDQAAGDGPDCLPLVPVGSQCADGGVRVGYCEEGSYCPPDEVYDGGPTNCASQLAVGAACDGDAACSSYECMAGQCVQHEPALCDFAPRFWRSDRR